MSSCATPNLPWYHSTLAVALAGSVLMWAALPPLALGWLGWAAPVPWLVLVQRESLLGRRPYGALWLAGFVFWLAAIHWLRLPHPAVYVGWIALSAYLACYLPVFVGLSRVAVHRVGVPLWLAAPVVWTGLELARAHLLTGFLMGSLAHTQVHWPAAIQISDLFGEYGVTFVMVLTAACLVSFGLRIAAWRLHPPIGNRQSDIGNPMMALVPAAAVLTVTLGYGQWRLAEGQGAGFASRLETAADRDDLESKKKSDPGRVRLALIQGNSLADWKMDMARQRKIMDEYVGLSHEALARANEVGDGRPVDLVVWPETMFRSSLTTFEAGYQLPSGVDYTIDDVAAVGPRDLANLVAQLGTAVLVGIDRVHVLAGNDFESDEWAPHYRAYNSSVLVDGAGHIVGTYDKMHRVMFGEYVPFSERLPFLSRLTSLTGSVDAGAAPAALELDGVVYSPNICYETTIPQVIRRQVATLGRQGRSPDVLVNLTNDAWYWGSSELDMHLACGVFRAVEMRRPLVIAANGGISAHIDRYGRIRAESPKQATDVIIADVELVSAASWYVVFGDWFAGACLAGCVALGIVGWRGRRPAKRVPARE